jgi:hypothetical protein
LVGDPQAAYTERLRRLGRDVEVNPTYDPSGGQLSRYVETITAAFTFALL